MLCCTNRVLHFAFFLKSVGVETDSTGTAMAILSSPLVEYESLITPLALLKDNKNFFALDPIRNRLLQEVQWKETRNGNATESALIIAPQT